MTVRQVEQFVQYRRDGSRVHRSLTVRGMAPLDRLRRTGVVPVGVSSEMVNSFVLSEAARRSSGSLNTVTTGPRALLRFLYMQRYTPTPLVDAVPVAPSWRDHGAVRALTPDEVARLLDGCDQSPRPVAATSRS